MCQMGLASFFFCSLRNILERGEQDIKEMQEWDIIRVIEKLQIWSRRGPWTFRDKNSENKFYLLHHLT